MKMQLLVLRISILTAVLFYSCNQNKITVNDAPRQTTTLTENRLRVGMVTGLKPEKILYYKELHANTWEWVLKILEECNIRNYSIYLKRIDDKYFLFSYYEYIGKNYEEDMKKIAADSIVQQWWKETDPCQQPLPESTAEGKIWASMEEVFHME